MRQREGERVNSKKNANSAWKRLGHRAWRGPVHINLMAMLNQKVCQILLNLEPGHWLGQSSNSLLKFSLMNVQRHSEEGLLDASAR